MLNNIAQQTSSQAQRKQQRKESSKNKLEDTHVYWVDVTIDNS